MNNSENDFDARYDDEDYYSMDLNIEAVRALHSHFEYALKMWPGHPARPAEEQEFLKHLRSKLFSIMMDYNFHNNDIDRP